MIEDDDARLIFFDLDGFAEEVHVAPDSGAPYTIRAIYDAPPTNTQNFDNRLPYHKGARPVGSNPQIQGRDIDLPKRLAGRAVLTLRGREYSIFKIEHDGTGMAYAEIRILAAE